MKKYSNFALCALLLMPLASLASHQAQRQGLLDGTDIWFGKLLDSNTAQSADPHNDTLDLDAPEIQTINGIQYQSLGNNQAATDPFITNTSFSHLTTEPVHSASPGQHQNAGTRQTLHATKWMEDHDTQRDKIQEMEEAIAEAMTLLDEAQQANTALTQENEKLKTDLSRCLSEKEITKQKHDLLNAQLGARIAPTGKIGTVAPLVHNKNPWKNLTDMRQQKTRNTGPAQGVVKTHAALAKLPPNPLG